MSDLGWISSLPRSWKVKPLRATADYVVSNVDKVPDDDEVPVRLCNYTDVYNNEFITLGLNFMPGTATEGEIEKFGLAVGDVIITKDSESWDDIGVPALVRETASDLVCGYHLALLRPRNGQIDGGFLFRCLQAKPVRVQLELAANGVTRFGIPKAEIGAAMLPVPPLPQQRAIADYLDRETARIDALIAAKERVLELLAEKRRALITRAVTRGVDPHAQLRDSGIPWLGEIPAHWELRKLAFLASLKSGESITADHITDEGVYAVYGGNGLRGYGERFTHEGEYVLIGRQGALCGNINYANGRFWASEHAVVVAPREPVVVRWLGELLRAMHLNQYSASAAQPGLAVETISALRVPIPPIQEQRHITDYVDRETTKLDNVSAATERTIALLKERRSALVAAAVTGQIDICQTLSGESAGESGIVIQRPARPQGKQA